MVSINIVIARSLSTIDGNVANTGEAYGRGSGMPSPEMFVFEKKQFSSIWCIFSSNIAPFFIQIHITTLRLFFVWTEIAGKDIWIPDHFCWLAALIDNNVLMLKQGNAYHCISTCLTMKFKFDLMSKYTMMYNQMLDPGTYTDQLSWNFILSHDQINWHLFHSFDQINWN